MTNDFVIRDGAFFRLDEFRCRGRNCCNRSLQISARLIAILDTVRGEFGDILFVSSGYRCPIHNKLVGGSPNSQHMRGTAADIRPGANAMKRFGDLVRIVRDINPPGFGVYANGDGSFVHLDVRDGPMARWGEWNTEAVAFELALTMATREV